MKKNNKGSIPLEYVLLVILVVIVCLFAYRFFGRTLSFTINNSANAVDVSTSPIIGNVSNSSGSNPGGSGGSGSSSGGSGSSGGESGPHEHNGNVIVSITPSTCESEGQIVVKCSDDEATQIYSLSKATNCSIENVLVVDSNIDTLNIDQSTKIQVTGNYNINSLTGNGDLCFEFDNPGYVLTIHESSNTKIPRGFGISTKYDNNGIYDVPIFDSYDGWLNDEYDYANDIEIGQIGASFNNLYGTGTLNRDNGGSYEVVDGIVKNTGISNITYNGDWTYDVVASKDASSVELELVFNYSEKGNGIEYYADSGYPFFEINSKVAVSDYDSNSWTSYVLRFSPNGTLDKTTAFIFNPNNPTHDYRVINISFE